MRSTLFAICICQAFITGSQKTFNKPLLNSQTNDSSLIVWSSETTWDEDAFLEFLSFKIAHCVFGACHSLKEMESREFFYHVSFNLQKWKQFQWNSMEQENPQRTSNTRDCMEIQVRRHDQYDHNYMYTHCLCSFSCCCDELPRQKQAEGERIYFAHSSGYNPSQYGSQGHKNLKQ